MLTVLPLNDLFTEINRAIMYKDYTQDVRWASRKLYPHDYCSLFRVEL